VWTLSVLTQYSGAKISATWLHEWLHFTRWYLILSAQWLMFLPLHTKKKCFSSHTLKTDDSMVYTSLQNCRFSIRNLPHVTLLVPRISWQCQNFWKICAVLLIAYFICISFHIMFISKIQGILPCRAMRFTESITRFT